MKLRSRVIRRLLQAIDLVLQGLFPPRSDRILYASIPDYADNACYLFQGALRTRRNLEHVWLMTDISIGSRIEDDFARLGGAENGHRLRLLRWHSLPAYWAFLRSRVVVHTHGLFNFSRAALRQRLRLGLWHGMVLKRVGRLNTSDPNPTPQFATHHFATSHFFRYVLAQAFEVPLPRILVTGQPRNDALVFPQSRMLDEAAVRQRLGLRADQRIIAWLPTFRSASRSSKETAPRSFLNDLDSEVLESLLTTARTHDVALVIKLHPLELSVAEQTLREHPGLRIYSDVAWHATKVQLYDFLAIADALISDVSSAMVDFAITGKPIGCIGFREQTYARGVAFPLQHFMDAASVQHLNDAANIADFVTRAAHAEQRAPKPSLAMFAEQPQHPACTTILELFA